MEHQSTLDEINSKFNISVQFFSPRCSPWSKASTTSKVETKARARQYERPGLQWIAYRCKQIFETNGTKAFILETPHGSQLLTDSPYANIHKHKSTSLAILDQCQHGAKDIDSRGLPNKKTTVLDYTGIKISQATSLRCSGENTRAYHGELSGKAPGTNMWRTATAAVYTWNM